MSMVGLIFIVVVVAVFVAERLLVSRGINALARRLPYGGWLLVFAGILVAAFTFTKLFFLVLPFAVGAGIYGYATGKLPGWYRQAAKTMGPLPFVTIPLEEQDSPKPPYTGYGTGLPR